jgi:hypothetical protein
LSVVVLVPMCFACGFFVPAWAAPLVFLPAPIAFVLGGALFITAQVLANRAHYCEVCGEWADVGAFSDPHALRECPRCGRWGAPGSTWADDTSGRGFPVVMPKERRADEDAKRGP